VLLPKIHASKLSTILSRKSLDAFLRWDAVVIGFHIIYRKKHVWVGTVHIFFWKYRFEMKNGVEKIKF